MQEGHFFGIELEPFRPVPAADATPDQARPLGQDTAEQPARAAHGPSQAEAITAETLAQLAASDWILDYPPADE